MDAILTFVLLFCAKSVVNVFSEQVSSALTTTFICTEMCNQRECPDDHFHCSYGACIPIMFTCDSKPDCYDWSDEDEILCGTVLPQGSCRLPGPKPGTHYKTSGCPRCRPGQVVPELTRLDYTCDIDGWLEGSDTVYCQNNQWLPSIPICLNSGNDTLDITCSPILEANGAIKRCESKWGPRKGWIPCEGPLPVGTNVFFDCPAFYERRAGSTHIVCLPDGTWSQIPLSCSPVCGIRESSTALIVNGWKVLSKEYMPWQATLFSHENGQWRFFCGGTLIGERVVLTAGHCVWRTFPETIRVAFGIISNNLDNIEEGGQVFDVDRIEIQNSYQDHEGNYASDIAVLILKMPVEITNAVRPACVNFSDSTLLQAQQNGDIGFVSGMGITENDTYSSTLRITSMRVISDEKCRESQHRDFRKYITYTSFCAGWANGTGVCNGDSGSGLILRRPNTMIWEVHGIVSISPRRLENSICDPHAYTVFTKVSLYGDWIRSIIEKIPVTEPSDIHRHPNNDDIII